MLEILAFLSNLIGYAFSAAVLYLIYKYIFVPVAKKQGWL